MRRDTRTAREEHEVGDVLVAIMRDVERADAGLLDHQRTSGYWLRRIPGKD